MNLRLAPMVWIRTSQLSSRAQCSQFQKCIHKKLRISHIRESIQCIFERFIGNLGNSIVNISIVLAGSKQCSLIPWGGFMIREWLYAASSCNVFTCSMDNCTSYPLNSRFPLGMNNPRLDTF